MRARNPPQVSRKLASQLIANPPLAARAGNAANQAETKAKETASQNIRGRTTSTAGGRSGIGSFFSAMRRRSRRRLPDAARRRCAATADRPAQDRAWPYRIWPQNPTMGGQALRPAGRTGSCARHVRLKATPKRWRQKLAGTEAKIGELETIKETVDALKKSQQELGPRRRQR